MQESIWFYILQIITIFVTLGLGIYNSIENKKSEHSHNVVSVTTTYRMKRSEQLKECCEKIITNSVPELLKENKIQAYYRLQQLYSASSKIAAICHRCFDADMELIKISERISDLSCEFVKAFYDGEDVDEVEWRLVGLTKLFIIKCDMYTYAEWMRIKKETTGKETQSAEWEEFYAGIKEKFNVELNEVGCKYNLNDEINKFKNKDW